MRDTLHSLDVRSAIAPAVYSDDNAPIVIDRLNFDSLTFALHLGVGGITFTATNRIDVLMEHSDDGVTFTPVVPTNVLGAVPDGTGIVKSQRTAHAAAAVYRFGYVDGLVGEKRYVRLRADFNGTHGTGTPISAVAILGHAARRPVA